MPRLPTPPRERHRTDKWQARAIGNHKVRHRKLAAKRRRDDALEAALVGQPPAVCEKARALHLKYQHYSAERCLDAALWSPPDGATMPTDARFNNLSTATTATTWPGY